MKRFLCAGALAFALPLLVVSADTAAAHGNITSSEPEAGARLRRAPRQVRVVLAEPPARGSALTVIDPCREEVSGKPERDGSNLSVAISGGSPGRWRVRLRSISSVDGHAISERFSFRVAGKRDCSPEDTEESGDDEDTATSSRPPIENEDEGSGFPLLPFALGTVAVIAVAIAVRAPRNRT